MDFEEIPSSIDDLPPPPSVPENNLSYDSVYELDENVLPDPDPVQEDALT